MNPAKLQAVAVLAVLFFTNRAQAQAPVIAYAARVGPDMSEVQAVSVGGDGSVYVASRTKPAADSIPKLFLAKLTPDGTSVQCSLSLDGNAYAMVVGDDGAVILTGSATSTDFPVTTSAPRSGRFLLRADICGKGVTYATWLPGVMRGIAVATDGPKIWVTTDETLLRYELGDSVPATQVPINGISGAIALGSGHLYVTGTRGKGPFRAFLMSLDPTTLKIEYDIAWGEGSVAAGSSLAVQTDGSVWVAGPAATENLAPNYREAGGVPYWGGSVMLAQVLPGGVVAMSRVLAQRLGGYNPVVGLGVDGRVWLAIPGATRYPHNLSTSPRVNGVYLRSLERNGDLSSDETMIPGSSAPVIAFGRSGRLAVASVTPGFPLSQGSIDSGSARGATTVVADLIVTNAPSLVCDRETLTVPRVLDTPYSGSGVYQDSKEISCSASDDSTAPFTAAIVPGPSNLSPDSIRPGYSIDATAGNTPASIKVTKLDTSADPTNTLLVLLSPGMPGLAVIPLGTVQYVVRPRANVLRGFDSLPGPGNYTAEATIALSWEHEGISLPVPFHLKSEVPWLAFDNADLVAPAEVRLRANTAGLPRGEHIAAFTVEVRGTAMNRYTLPLRIGSVFRVQGASGDIQVPGGNPFTHTIQIQTAGEPMNFSIDAPSGPFTIAPLTGTTPADIRVTFDPKGYAAGERPRFLTAIRSEDLVWGLVVTYRIVGRDAVVLPDQASGTGAPGKLIYYSAGGDSRCDDSARVMPPWPTVLGGCKLYVNGQPVPLASVIKVRGPENPNWLVAPVYSVPTQLPYDIQQGTARLEFEDRNGRITSASLIIQPLAPEWLGIEGVKSQEIPARKPGESITLFMTGLGATDAPAPIGDVPAKSVRPLGLLEVFVGGRAARILSAELSSTEPGVVPVTVEIPNLAADTHSMVVRINGIETDGGVVRVLPK